MKFINFLLFIFIIYLIYKLRFFIKDFINGIFGILSYDPSVTAFSVFLIFFVAMVLSLKEMVGGFETFNNSKLIDLSHKDKEEILNSEHFNQYINNVHTNMYNIKLKPFNKHFKKEYMERIVLIPNEYKIKLTESIEEAQKKINESKLSALNKIPWKILISRNGLEMNMPFTIDECIIIPLDNLKYIQNNSNNEIFIKTLIHEKIHILQRKNQDIFNNFYKDNFKFVELNSKLQNIPEQWNKINMTNPDSNFDSWIYKYNLKEYLPLLVVINGQTKEFAFNINNLDEYIDLRKVILDESLPKNCSLYHPNEILACDLADKIMLNKITNSYNKLFDELK
jgi:hypothetical protein